MAELIPHFVPIEPDTHHLFAGGVYARAMMLNMGETIVGKRHRKPCINVLLWGRVRVVNEAEPEGFKEYQGGDLFTSPEGTRRAMIALQDSCWVTFHATEETDQDKLEKAFIMGDEE